MVYMYIFLSSYSTNTKASSSLTTGCLEWFRHWWVTSQLFGLAWEYIMTSQNCSSVSGNGNDEKQSTTKHTAN